MARATRSPRAVTHRDLVGVGIVASLALWVLFAGPPGEGRPWPVLELLTGMVVAFAAGRMPWRTPELPYRLVAVAVAGAVALSWPGVLRADGPPTGYANANASLTAIAVFAALAVGTRSHGAARRAWTVLAAALYATTILTGSIAGVASLSLALGLLTLERRTHLRGLTVLGGAVVVAAAVVATTGIAFGVDAGGLDDRLGVRAELWAEALAMAEEHPLQGIGPGQFASQTAVSRDDDLRWVHHGYLQVAAELGAVGLALVACLATWIGAQLLHQARRCPRRAAWGAGATVVIGVHATMDYVWHVPTVMLVFALVLGSSTAPAPGPELEDDLQRRGQITGAARVTAAPTG